MRSHLKGKIIVVTGAAGILGRELCKSLAIREHSIVWGIDLNEENLRTLRSDIEKYGGRFEFKAMDVCDQKATADLLNEIREKNHRGIEIWINNAGVQKLGTFSHLDVNDFNRIIDVNFTALVNCTRLVLNHMTLEARGTIVNIASVAGLVAAPYMCAYTASKHAVVGFTRALQTELKFQDSPIRLVLIAPGFFESSMIREHETLNFPAWLNWLVSQPQQVSHDIIRTLKGKKDEFVSSWHGKGLVALHSLVPKIARGSSRLLLAKSWRDAVFQKFEKP